MTFVRPARRVLAAASLSALLVVAACGGGGETPAPAGSAPAGADFSKQGDIEYWVGKDTSANQNLSKIVAAFNAQHPNGKVTAHELPDDATQQRQ
jgi:multiple sugar transport system substrate-binding protein